ncbi:dTDP-4-dehydrorhamnose 3,5-epimerase [Anabaena sp. UHCC 0399]|uniref:dTDP-4-dehydrorhamnose 3,5-epimerase n=1 Tax=Anabaena sp. UHCC 0399 TaxID=3110238 RepID=UPI0016836E71|nr:dTDP-4-dehydrorhamnose 3,5-epimerase [Anabaena sp. UHCC 0399]MBD2359712.1 dTDP-4-dehydrorhamnose 3,5-epimerase [Anabaena minutissima FACHB-250]MEA5568520.1 dTDP-4-dehydrorhamnose 3,5-epimerase [Anabaena sp. UHCC 0399]
MIFTTTELKDAFIIDLEEKSDNRGFFARTFCAQEFAAHGLKPVVSQCNLSYNYQKGTLRGMHYQLKPAAETKLIRCIKGAIYDVIIDMRPESPTFLSHIGVELTSDNHRALYVPEMFAHGYQALTDDAEIVYQVGEFYTPGYERGLRYNDPFFNIDWPLEVTVISEKDANWPLLENIPIGSPDPVEVVC